MLPWGDSHIICGSVVIPPGIVTLQSRVKVCPTPGIPSTIFSMSGEEISAKSSCELRTKFDYTIIPSSFALPSASLLVGPSPAKVLADICTLTSW